MLKPMTILTALVNVLPNRSGAFSFGPSIVVNTYDTMRRILNLDMLHVCRVSLLPCRVEPYRA